MNYTVLLIFSFSIAFAAITGWVRFKKMDPAFYPFIALVTIATLNEIVSAIFIQYKNSNAINANTYSLLEAILILLQFNKWRLFSGKKRQVYFILVLFLTTWICENFFVSTINQFSSYFNILYGFVTVMMSISIINRQMVSDQPYYCTRSIILICFCFSIYYTYSVFIETFCIWGSGASKIFRISIYRILCYVNLFTNLAYALAILWIPRKRKFLRLC